MKIISTIIIWFSFRCINSLRSEEFDHIIIATYHIFKILVCTNCKSYIYLLL